MKNRVPPGFEHLMLPWIGKTMKHIDLFIQSKLAEQGVHLSRQQVVLMKILYQDGPLPQNDLAFLTDRDKTSLTRLLSGMENKNLVARITSADDKRVNLVHLTKNGEKVLNETAPLLLAIASEMEKNVSQEDKDAVVRVMKTIQENIDFSCSNNK
ncbi:MAG: MarR family transcriptional regulator [Flavobacteriales bacterium]|nr:MarR family transcriptional regulator [Flavobacteriales bacterium]